MRDNLTGFIEVTLRELEKMVGKQCVLVYEIEIYGKQREELYHEGEFDYVKLRLGLKILTEDLNTWTIIQDCEFKKPKGVEDLDCVQYLIGQIMAEADYGKGFIVKEEEDTYRVCKVEEKTREVMFTVMPEIFCARLIVNAVKGYKQVPVIIDECRIVGAENLKHHLEEGTYKEVKKVNVWGEHETVVDFADRGKDFRVGKTFIEMGYEDTLGDERMCTVQVPYIIRTDENSAKADREYLQRSIKDMMNS